MAEIRTVFFLRHLRAEATSHVIHYRAARVRHSARGAAFFFDPLVDSIAEIPLDDRELQLVIHGRTSDYQDITAQGMMTYRLVDPEQIARRFDFTIGLRSGKPLGTPLEKMELMLSQMAEQHAQSYLAHTDVRTALTDGSAATRIAIETALGADGTLADAGLAIVSVRITSMRPSADLEKAIEAPTRESIKAEADEAAFGRRAMAVQKERAIAENELQNRIELAKREESLIEQSGENERNRALHAAEAGRIEADAEAAALAAVEGARLAIERQKVEAYATVPPAVMFGLAARDFAARPHVLS